MLLYQKRLRCRLVIAAGRTWLSNTSVWWWSSREGTEAGSPQVTGLSLDSSHRAFIASVSHEGRSRHSGAAKAVLMRKFWSSYWTSEIVKSKSSRCNCFSDSTKSRHSNSSKLLSKALRKRLRLRRTSKWMKCLTDHYSTTFGVKTNYEEFNHQRHRNSLPQRKKPKKAIQSTWAQNSTNVCAAINGSHSLFNIKNKLVALLSSHLPTNLSLWSHNRHRQVHLCWSHWL